MSRLAGAVDTALDVTLVGYTKAGFRVRAGGWAKGPAARSMEGRSAVVTGARSGLGRATVLGLARSGARVRMVVRAREGGEQVADELRSEIPGAELTVEECDVSSLDAVRAYAAGSTDPVDVLVHNAGTMTPKRSLTHEGNEVTLATHVLGPHLLTALLREHLRPGARVIWVSSGGMYTEALVDDDLQYARGEFSATTAYARTKRMQVVLADRWAQELAPAGVHVFSTHPGWVDTPGVAQHLPRFRALTRPFLRTSEEGADTVLWLAAAEEGGRTTGGFWHDRRRRPEHYLGRRRETPAQRDAMWQEVQRLTGLSQ